MGDVAPQGIDIIVEIEEYILAAKPLEVDSSEGFFISKETEKRCRPSIPETPLGC
jgi:hypothetical protein